MDCARWTGAEGGAAWSRQGFWRRAGARSPDDIFSGGGFELRARAICWASAQRRCRKGKAPVRVLHAPDLSTSRVGRAKLFGDCCFSCLCYVQTNDCRRLVLFP
jgi:hypothetical protein